MTRFSDITSPKRQRRESSARSSFYRYYAGFSADFASQCIEAMGVPKGGLVLDPWNGAGTTTTTCAERGLRAVGIDLNPVMVLVARARLLSKHTSPSVEPLCARIVSNSRAQSEVELGGEALLDWFSVPTAISLRRLERSTRQLLIDAKEQVASPNWWGACSDLAAFFYVGLFRLVRRLMSAHQSSNPTWYRRPGADATPVHVASAELDRLFTLEMMSLRGELESAPLLPPQSASNVSVEYGTSSQLPLASCAVDAILTSPPYCTRIDYAVATAGELAVLGLGLKSGFGTLRRELMGASTVPADIPAESPLWGLSCLELLDSLAHHKSKCSGSYYYKNHARYFDQLSNSMSEVARVLRVHGECAIVVQTSFYKELLIDLPQICSEMAEYHSLETIDRRPFEVGPNLSMVNSRSNAYRSGGKREREEVVVLKKH